MFILCKKLQHLKELNKLHFSHISERVSRSEMELETHQTAFHYDKDNLQYLALDKQLRQKLFYLKFAERLFFCLEA
jgi:RNA binding exosome subunit